MARRSRSSAPARSAPAPAAPSRHAAPQRPTTAVAAPPPAQVPAVPQPQSQGPGLFGQMAATAGGVAVGSTVGHVIGHGITSLFSGGSSSEPAPQPQQQHYQQPYAPQEAYNNSSQLSAGGAACEADAKAFNTCMERNDFDVSKCQFYLDMLKDCRAFSKTL